jgi:hypothetical protein
MTKTATTSRGGNVKRAKRRKPPAKPPTPTLPIRITGDLIDRVDALKPDLIPREPYIRQLLADKLTEMENEEEE